MTDVKVEKMPIGDNYPLVDFSRNIVLECSDGVACVMPISAAKRCNVLAQLISKSAGEVKVPLYEIHSDIVAKICMYIQHHHSEWPPNLRIDKPLRTDLRDALTAWDYDFYTKQLLEDGDPSKNDAIFLVLKAAQYLECDPVRDLACAALANIVRDVKGEEDFYKLFKVSEPFTEDETKKLYEDYEYRSSKKDE
eukprot:TRINITY_DN13507_c0_g1_i1.p1 TRINITY_DN13507_c0_g1~~TRINITY_DN13507_c0_g1_i1.p1  ORF type:complete len:216 (+),score=84.78 TRINITY_DN13507_c0_g1_i1:67-648(+)